MQSSKWPYLLIGAGVGILSTIVLMGCGGGLIYWFSQGRSPEQFQWRELRSDGFRVSMPAEAVPVTTEHKTTGGVVRTSVYTAYTSNDRRRIFQVVCKKYPTSIVKIEGTAAEVLIRGRNEVIASLHGFLRGQRPLSPSEYKEEIGSVFDSPGFGEVQVRTILSDDTLYHVIAIRGVGISDKGETRRFLDSFELLGEKPVKSD